MIDARGQARLETNEVLRLLQHEIDQSTEIILSQKAREDIIFYCLLSRDNDWFSFRFSLYSSSRSKVTEPGVLHNRHYHTNRKIKTEIINIIEFL